MSLTNPQQSAQEPKGTSILQTLTRFASVGVIISLLYVAWTFYARHASDEQAARDLAARQQAERQHQADLIFGSGEVKIVSYSVDKSAVARGESADLCYGVVNATKVVIEPHVEDSKPSSYHCLTVAPRATTTYTITASNDKGEAKSLAVTVHVH
jgi:hypothetical protein